MFDHLFRILKESKETEPEKYSESIIFLEFEKSKKSILTHIQKSFC